MILKALGMPFVSEETVTIVEFLFTRWEKELKGENPYLLISTTPLRSYYLEFMEDDRENLSDWAINLTGGHNMGGSQRGYFVYYPKRPDFEVFVSAEYSGLIEYRQKIDSKIGIEYIREKLGRFLQLCSLWYMKRNFKDDVLLVVALSNAREIKLINSSSEYSQPVPEPLIISHHQIPCSELTDLGIKGRIIREFKGAFNIY
jgi:hypothetical protein